MLKYVLLFGLASQLLISCGPTTGELTISSSEPQVEEVIQPTPTVEPTPTVAPVTVPEEGLGEPEAIAPTNNQEEPNPTNIKDPYPIDRFTDDDLERIERKLQEIDRTQSEIDHRDIVEVDTTNEVDPVIEINDFESIISQLPVKGNIAKTVTSIYCDGKAICKIAGETTTFCDQSLATKTQIDEYRKLLSKRNPDSSLEQIEEILEKYVQDRKQNCAELTHTAATTYKIKSNMKEGLFLFVESCPGINKPTSSQFDCDTRSIALTNKEQDIKLSSSDKLILLSSGDPINGIGQNPHTNIGILDHFWLDPHAVPSNRNLRITQEYDGSFSHDNTYAVDFGLRLGESVASSKAGVIITNNTGSKVRCSKGDDDNFRIYKNNVQVTTSLNSCRTDCKYSEFPSICHSTNAANLVRIAHADNTYSKYMHLAPTNPHASFGDVVAQGENIATIGLSGWVNGAHLHFEVNQIKVNKDTVTFPSIPVHFMSRFREYTIYPDNEGTIVEVPLDPDAIEMLKSEWHGKMLRFENLAGDSADFDCKTRFAAFESAPPMCHYTVTGSGYWHPSFSTTATRRVAESRATAGVKCLEDILGDDISTTLLVDIGDQAQERSVAEQKAMRSIQVEVSCEVE